MARPSTSRARRASGNASKLPNGFRSGLEKRIADDLSSRGVDYEYEKFKVTYAVPERQARYTPDFRLPNGIIVEAKGIFDAADRQKHILVKDQRPELDIRFIFSRSSAPLYKGSSTTYADWCRKNGFQFAEKLIPPAWLKEPPRNTDADPV